MAAPLSPAVRQARGAPATLLGRLRRLPWLFLVLLLLIWAGPLFLPGRIGLRLTLGYQLFYTAILLSSGAFFWFLGKERIPHPTSPLGVLGSIALVYLATVAVLVGAGLAYPQFAVPRGGEVEALADPVARGKALFFGDTGGCFLCHTIGGTGGTRGPDLTAVGERAGSRVPGLTAEQYLREKVRAGSAYDYKVPDYVPIMPAFGQILTEEGVQDLVQYLLSHK